MPIESSGVHTRGSSEVFINAASNNKKLMINAETRIHYWMYTPEILEQYKAFFNYWLKGKENGIMSESPMKMVIQTKRRGYYWQNEDERGLLINKMETMYS